MDPVPFAGSRTSTKSEVLSGLAIVLAGIGWGHRRRSQKGLAPVRPRRASELRPAGFPSKKRPQKPETYKQVSRRYTTERGAAYQFSRLSRAENVAKKEGRAGLRGWSIPSRLRGGRGFPFSGRYDRDARWDCGRG